VKPGTRLVLERHGRNTGAFVLHYHAHLHPPYGLWRVYYLSREVGTQLSVPSLEDCERMLSVLEVVPAVGTAGAAPPPTPDAVRRARGVRASNVVHRNRTLKAKP
jgi:hypothetical protein